MLTNFILSQVYCVYNIHRDQPVQKRLNPHMEANKCRVFGALSISTFSVRPFQRFGEAPSLANSEDEAIC